MHLKLPHWPPALPSWLPQLGGRLAVPVVIALSMLVVGIAALLAFRHWRERRMAHEARFVTVYSPAVVDPQGGVQLWSNLVALLRPHWRRLVLGQPHVAFEIAWAGPQLRVGIWIPGAVPPGWSNGPSRLRGQGARTEVSDPPEPLPAAWAAMGGELALALEDWLPLRLEHPTDPFRALAGAAGGLSGDQAAAVQVLARPVTGRRVRRSFEAAAALRHGTPPWGVARLLEGTHAGRRRRTWRCGGEASARPRGPERRPADPRQGGGAAMGGAGPLRGGDRCRPPAAGGPGLARGRAHALAAAFAVHTGRNRLRPRRRGDIATALARRDFGRGSLVPFRSSPRSPICPVLSRRTERTRRGSRRPPRSCRMRASSSATPTTARRAVSRCGRRTSADTSTSSATTGLGSRPSSKPDPHPGDQRHPARLRGGPHRAQR